MKNIFALAAAVLILALAPAARAASDQQDVVNGAYVMMEEVRTGRGAATNVRELLHRARAILIVPELVKGGFFVGAQGGSGILLTRDSKNDWSYPAFYTLGAGSFGLQIGVEVSKVSLIIMNDKALNAVMKDEFKVGAEAGIAVATLGTGAEASTTAAGGADIYAFAESKGLFGGIAIQGGVIHPRPSYNTAYYNHDVSAQAIVIKREAQNSGADQLRSVLNRISTSK